MATYLGRTVFELIPNRPAAVPEGVTRSHRVLDSVTGARWMDVMEAAAVGDRSLHWPCFTRLEALTQRQWLDARKGVTVPLWIPTFEPDLLLAASASQDDAEITIEPVEYSGRLWPGSYSRRHLAVFARGEPVSYHYVSAASDPGGGSAEALTLSPALPCNWSAGTTKLSFLRFCRLKEPFIDRVWVGSHFCDAAIHYLEVSKETPGGA